MTKVFIQSIYGNLFSTIIALIVLAFAYGLVVFVFSKQIEGNRQRHRFRLRSFYVACIIFIFVMAKIWVEGFAHIFTVISFVAAALVVTNKETIMNLTGWLIITWRNLFVEGDLILVQQYKGYVESMGPLYFTIFEVSSSGVDVTGRVIRLPNGLVTNNAIINMSQTSHLLEQNFNVTVYCEGSLSAKLREINDMVHHIITDFYKHKKEFSVDYICHRNKGFKGSSAAPKFCSL